MLNQIPRPLSLFTTLLALPLFFLLACGAEPVIEDYSNQGWACMTTNPQVETGGDDLHFVDVEVTLAEWRPSCASREQSCEVERDGNILRITSFGRCEVDEPSRSPSYAADIYVGEWTTTCTLHDLEPGDYLVRYGDGEDVLAVPGEASEEFCVDAGMQ